MNGVMDRDEAEWKQQIPDCTDCGTRLQPSYAAEMMDLDRALYECPSCYSLYKVSIYADQTPTYCEPL